MPSASMSSAPLFRCARFSLYISAYLFSSPLLIFVFCDKDRFHDVFAARKGDEERSESRLN